MRPLFRRAVRAYRASYAGLPRPVWILALASFINRTGTMVLPFLALYITRAEGLSVVEAGQILSAYGLGGVAASWLGGSLADRIGPVRVQILSFAGAGAGLFTLPFLHGFGALVAGVFAVGVIAESFRPALFTAVAHFAPPERRARSMALIRVAINLGFAVGPAVGGLLAAISYDLLFVADGLTCWAAAVVLLVSVRRIGPIAEPPVDASGGSSPWRDTPFLLFLVLIFLMASVFFQIMSTWPLYLGRAYGLGEAQIGLLLAFSAILVALFEMPILKAVEGRSHLWVAAVGALLLGVGFGALPLGGSFAFAACSVVIWTSGEMLALPLTNAVPADRAAPASRGRYMGAYTLAFSLAFVAAPATGTAVLEQLGGAVLWMAVAATAVAVAAGFAALAPLLGRPRS